MTKKYELLDSDTVQSWDDRTLKRIKALVSIGLSVSAGDLGGYVESEKHLSQVGNAWVYGDAQVFGNALVYGNAWVSGDAQVSGDARVSGNARVFGDARVSGDAQVYGDARVSGNAWVSGDAWVSGNAWVSGDARVSGDAQVYGNALVFGNALVYGNAWVSGDARVSGNARVESHIHLLIIGPAKSTGRFTTAHIDKELKVRVNCGCFSGTVKQFSESIEKTHANNQTNLEQYRLFCQLIAFNFGITE